MAASEVRFPTAVDAYLAGALHPSELVTALDGSDAADIGFWTGVALLDDGQDDRAATALRGWLVDAGDSPLRPTADALVVVAEGGLVEAVRDAVDEDPQGWRRRCPVALDLLVDVLADEDPALLCRVLELLPDDGSLPPATAERATRAVLVLATGSEHVGLVHARLRVAERLLGVV